LKHYLGIDVGSVSVKFAVLSDSELVAKVYLRNRGLIETVQEGLRQLPPVEFSAVGITGSGKEFVKILVGADYTDSEIIAHMVATLKQYPEARTILDIGGEDSKLMLVRDGVLFNFQMNHDCGGGTGSMIETIASRLGVDIEDVGDIALSSKQPATLPGKCGIFCQSAAVSHLSRGRPAGDILMGVCRALVGNYLAVLAKGKRLEPLIVFQGATAKNKALVHCFEEALGQPVVVPENCSFMGAIGIAHLAGDNMNDRKTSFRGEAILEPSYSIAVGRCHDCENQCELLRLMYCGEVISVMGSQCGKYDS